MDAVTGAVVIVGLQKVVGPGAAMVSSVVARILGPPADAAGEILATPLRNWVKQRQQRAERIVLDAAEIVIDEKQKAQRVPGSFLQPILEHGSLEDDGDMRKTWARLLASAAMPDFDSPILTAFPHVLAEMTPLEVRVFEFMMENVAKKSKFSMNGHFWHTCSDEAPLRKSSTFQRKLDLRFGTISCVFGLSICSNLHRRAPQQLCGRALRLILHTPFTALVRDEMPRNRFARSLV